MDMRHSWIGIMVGVAAAALSSPAHAAPARECADMAGLTVPASAIGLPTRGARVTAATSVAASGTAPRTVGASCRVLAEIDPVDPAAPPIRMEVNLPEAWNGKALMYGGGGYNGVLLSSPGFIRLQPTEMPVPLGRGYATFSSDSGHRSPNSEAAFALNEEAMRNFAYDALKKTRDAAVQLIEMRYGRPADRLYFHGSSTGGKEALGMIQRNPADLDGAIVFWPATNLTGLVLQHASVAQALLRPGAYLSVSQRRAVLRAAIQACDPLDGAVDGIIANSRQCQAVFDPEQAVVDGRPLRCPEGSPGDDCLTAAQIAALRTSAAPIRRQNGASYPGFNTWGTEFGSRTDDDLSRTITTQGFGTVPSALPTVPGMPFMQNYAEQFFRYFVARDAAASLAEFDPANPGRWQPRLDELAALMDLADPDLTAFARRGGKILLVHGTADQIVPVQATAQYYDAVVGRMGREQVAAFLRFYELPATAHSGNSTQFMPSWDILGALDAWVLNGTPPENPVVVDIYAHPGRSRPLCEYPSWPRYNGTGSIEEASSFTCTR